ncbi:MAG: bifunctional nuclease family protein [Candidatus Anammoxibacter sp.]
MNGDGTDDMVLMVLSKIMISEASDHQIIVLKEKDGERNFPIVIGIQEAWAIDRAVKNIPTPRPLTHDLLSNVIKGLTVEVDRITINDLRNNTFYATIVLKQNGANVAIDSRPSDAIVLATQMKSKIYVSKHIIDEVCKMNTI